MSCSRKLDSKLLDEVKDKVWLSKINLEIESGEGVMLKYYPDDCVQIFDRGAPKLVLTSSEVDSLIVALIAARQIWDFNNE